MDGLIQEIIALGIVGLVVGVAVIRRIRKSNTKAHNSSQGCAGCHTGSNCARPKAGYIRTDGIQPRDRKSL